MTKTQIEKADVKALRAFAATKKVKFIGKTTVDLRAELIALIPEKKEKKAAAPAKKEAKKVAAKKTVKKGSGEKTKAANEKLKAAAKPAKKVKAAKKDAAPKAENERKVRVLPTDDILTELEKFDTKKAKVLHLREKGFSLNAIGIVVGMHPTNVSRYIRDAGLSTSDVTVPKERRDRIKATIAAKKA